MYERSFRSMLDVIFLGKWLMKPIASLGVYGRTSKQLREKARVRGDPKMLQLVRRLSTYSCVLPCRMLF